MEKKQRLIYILISFLILGLFMYCIKSVKGEMPYWLILYLVWFLALASEDLFSKMFEKLQIKMQKKYIYVLSLVLQVMVLLGYCGLINL